MSSPFKLQGQTALITGATSGIGRATARALAQMGATVIVAGRSEDRCRQTVRIIREATGSTMLDYAWGDLASQSEVRHMAACIKERHARIDILINNAGAMFASWKQTCDGHEMTFAINYLSHFLLTHLLMDVLARASSTRIINVASHMHNHGHIDFDDLQLQRGYSSWTAYSNAKLAQVLFTAALAERLAGTQITVNALHPGAIRYSCFPDTGITASSHLTPDESAQLSVYLASSPEVAGITGQFYYGHTPAFPACDAADPQTIQRLWDASVALTEPIAAY